MKKRKTVLEKAPPAFLRRACKRRASQFNSLLAWGDGHSPSYRIALNMGVQKEIAYELGWEVKEIIPADYWTFEICKEGGRPFRSLTSWKQDDHATYRAAFDNGWHKEIAAELGWKVQEQRCGGYWNYDTIKAEAAKFSGLYSWAKGEPNSYRQALKKKNQKQIAKELGWGFQDQKPNGYWVEKTCKREASKHSPTTWKKAHTASYRKAAENGWKDKIILELWGAPAKAPKAEEIIVRVETQPKTKIRRRKAP